LAQRAAQTYINRLNAISSIAEVDLHIEEVVGPDKTLDVVVDIFNRVNSGGTKLSKGDLALARIGAQWPEARAELKKRLAKYEQAGFYFKLDWLLRNVNAVATGQSLFDSLEAVNAEEFRAALGRTERRIDWLLNLIAGRLGLDHDRVLGSRYAVPLLARYLETRGGQVGDPRERDRLLYWYVHTLLWGRYSGSTESVLAQDLNQLTPIDGALDRLIALLRQNRGDLRVHPDDFLGASRGARFYPLLYMLTRVWQARDWETGNPLHGHLLGAMSRLEVHHIFPRAQLKKRGHKVSDRNALANFTFLTKETNLRVSDRLPIQYLTEYASRDPALVASHWIPMDPKLWELDRYQDFLAARRELLARAANDFLASLLGGELPAEATRTAVIAADGTPVRSPARDQEDEIIEGCRAWLAEHALPAGERNYELVSAEAGEALATIDLAWPDGLQEGLSEPVALLLDEPEDVREAVQGAGFRCFTDVETFRDYVRRSVLGETEDDEDEAEDLPATRESWAARVDAGILVCADRIVELVNRASAPYGRTYTLSYRKHFLGLNDGERARNFVHFYPRKRYLRVGAQVSAGVGDPLVARLVARGAKATGQHDRMRINLLPEDYERLLPMLEEVIGSAVTEEHAERR